MKVYIVVHDDDGIEYAIRGVYANRSQAQDKCAAPDICQSTFHGLGEYKHPTFSGGVSMNPQKCMSSSFHTSECCDVEEEELR